MNSVVSLTGGSQIPDISTLATAIAKDIGAIPQSINLISTDHEKYDDQSHMVVHLDWRGAEKIYNIWKDGGDMSSDGVFFLQYFDHDNIPEEDSLEIALDRRADEITQMYQGNFRERYEDQYNLAYTSSQIHIWRYSSQDMGDYRELLRSYIRYFIMERGLPLPTILERESAGHFLFADHSDDVHFGMSHILGLPAPVDEPHIPATRFIREVFEKFSQHEKLTFSIANAIGFYLDKNGKYISKSEFQQMIKPLIVTGKFEKNFMSYMFRTEIVLHFGIGNLLHRLDISTDPIVATVLRGAISGWGVKGVDMKYLLPVDTKRDEIVSQLMIGGSFSSSQMIDAPSIKKGYIAGMTQRYVDDLLDYSSRLSGNHRIVPFLFEDYVTPQFPSIQVSVGDILSLATDIHERMQMQQRALSSYRAIMDPLYLRDTSTIGGKIHFYSEPSAEQLAALGHIMPRGRFSLIHANMTLNLPPCQSPIELVCILYKLQQIGVIRDSDLDIQLSIPSRLPEHLCAILGSAMIWLKSYQVEYPEEAFHTTHDSLTGACIVAYDAGVLDKSGFSNLDVSWEGRTDILGVKKIEEVFVYHVLGELLRGYHMQSRYSEAGSEFIHGYRAILDRYNMVDILDQKWVHNPTYPASMTPDEYMKHPKVVKRCTDMLNSNIDIYNQTGDLDGLMIFEIQELFARITQQCDLVYDFPRIHRVVHQIVPLDQKTQVLL